MTQIKYTTRRCLCSTYCYERLFVPHGITLTIYTLPRPPVFVKWLTTCMFRPYNTIRHNDYDGSLQLHVPATLQLFHDATHMLNAAWLAPYIYHARSSTQIQWLYVLYGSHHNMLHGMYHHRVTPQRHDVTTNRQTDNDRHD
jgi:hypothetical protein